MRKLLTDKAFDFLESYINNSSPTGFELNGQKLWLDYIKPFADHHFQDNYNNTVAIINPDARFKVVLEAHADEISWMVNYIDEKGFIHVLPNGGADPMVAPGKHVTIHGDHGLLP